MRIHRFVAGFAALVAPLFTVTITAAAETWSSAYEFGCAVFDLILDAFPWRPDARESLRADAVAGTAKNVDDRAHAFLAFIGRSLRHACYRNGGFAIAALTAC